MIAACLRTVPSTLALSTPVLAQPGCLGQAIGSDCSDLQRSKEAGSAMVSVKQGQRGPSCHQLRHNLRTFPQQLNGPFSLLLENIFAYSHSIRKNQLCLVGTLTIN